MEHNLNIRIDLETALLLDKTSFNCNDMEDWNHHIFTKNSYISDEAIEKYGNLTDDGFYELTVEGGGDLPWNEIYSNDWHIDTYGYVPNNYLLCPTMYEVQEWLIKEHKIFVLVYPYSSTSFRFEIINLNISQNSCYFSEINLEYHEALKDGIKKVLKDILS